EIDQPDRADACGREIQQRGRHEPTRADAEHARRLQPPLAVFADLRQEEMAAVALTFARGHIRKRQPASVLRRVTWSVRGTRIHSTCVSLTLVLFFLLAASSAAAVAWAAASDRRARDAKCAHD